MSPLLLAHTSAKNILYLIVLWSADRAVILHIVLARGSSEGIIVAGVVIAPTAAFLCVTERERHVNTTVYCELRLLERSNKPYSVLLRKLSMCSRGQKRSSAATASRSSSPDSSWRRCVIPRCRMANSRPCSARSGHAGPVQAEVILSSDCAFLKRSDLLKTSEIKLKCLRLKRVAVQEERRTCQQETQL